MYTNITTVISIHAVILGIKKKNVILTSLDALMQFKITEIIHTFNNFRIKGLHGIMFITCLEAKFY